MFVLSILMFRNRGQFYDGDKAVPVFEWTPQFQSPNEAANILAKPIKDEFVCCTTPRNVSHNTRFVFNVRSLKSKIGTRSVHVGSREKIDELRNKNRANTFLMPYKACFSLGGIVRATQIENKN